MICINYYEYLFYTMKPAKVISISVTSYGGRDNKTFDYLVKHDQNFQIGCLVDVNFKQKQTIGIVRAIKAQVSLNNNYRLLSINEKLAYKPLPNHLLALADWMVNYYNASQRSVWQTMLPGNLKVKLRKLYAAKSYHDTARSSIRLNPEQRKSVELITHDQARGYLLNGITGSGKTEVYIKLLESNLKRGKSAIVLVPEIALTPQMVERLTSRFTGSIIVTHSHMTAAARKRVWLEVLESDRPYIVVGPRSALFMPLDNLGLIIIDEEHETSYKQESSPRYQANHVAATLSQLTGAKYILGSATPSISSAWLASQGRLLEVRMDNRALGQRLPHVTIVDLKNKNDLLSKELKSAIDQTLANKRQVLLFLNQRGSAQAYLCRNCGHSIRCPNCETSLTMHGDRARLLCHYCNYQLMPPAVCPNCTSDQMFFIGSGTKAIEAELKARYPHARTARIDRDNATFEHLEDTYQKLKQGEIDIVIGTQMIARGLDIAGIDLVGVILADSMLNIPDFSASERTFQLLTQVAGRTGRTTKAGQVIIQTFSPKHPAIEAASKHDTSAFYKYELPHRQKFHYPPFCYLAKLTYNNISDSKALAVAERTAALLRQTKDVTVIGPAPAFVRKAAGKYRWHLILKSYHRSKLVSLSSELKSGWTVDLDPLNLL